MADVSRRNPAGCLVKILVSAWLGFYGLTFLVLMTPSVVKARVDLWTAGVSILLSFAAAMFGYGILGRLFAGVWLCLGIFALQIGWSIERGHFTNDPSFGNVDVGHALVVVIPGVLLVIAILAWIDARNRAKGGCDSDKNGHPHAGRE